MAEYIARDALLKEVDDLKKSPWYNDDFGNGIRLARHDGVDCVVNLCIKQVPAADVVEVVRCRDCKKHYKDGFCDVFDVRTKAKDYCSYGEMRGN